MQFHSGGKRGSQAGITLIELLVSMIILGIVTTMLVASWISLQRASAFAVQSSNARASARDAIDRISSELRDSQPQTLPTASATPTPSPSYPLFTVAQPMEAVFYSSFNQEGANLDGSGVGTGVLMPTRIHLDTSGTTAQKTLYWQRKTDQTSGWTAGYRQILLARNVVNNSVSNTDVSPTTPYTAIFRYGYRDVNDVLVWTDNADDSLDLSTIVAVQVRLIVDANTGRAPKYTDLSTTVIPRNVVAD
jgi:prepilin-type N-terminal cleavage/methylation domain-containing protein